MHIVFGISGIKHDVELAIKWLETRMFELPVTDKDGKKQTAFIGSNFRQTPFFNLYELVCPREYLYKVINTLNLKPYVNVTNGKGTNKKGVNKGKAMRKFATHVNVIRKIMKLKKLPKPDETAGEIPFPKNLNIRFIGVGYKDDIDMTFPNGLTHEAI